jgi:hypothetical protein
MKFHLLAAVLFASGSLLLAQEERKVPKDSARVTLRGCVSNRTFIVGPRTAESGTTLEIEPGRRFRLNGSKDALESIKKRGEDRMVEVTGLIRKADLAKPGGLAVAGGRIRIGGAAPQQPLGNPGSDPAYNQAVMDVESSRPLAEPCPAQ